MAINVYAGIPGSGKSYESVVSVILPALASGRRVVTNLAGLNEKLMHEYILSNRGKFSKKSDLSVDDLGTLKWVSEARIKESFFFPDSIDAPGAETVVEPGDLVVIDEVWRFWPKDGIKPSHEHMQFFKMHRHYAHPETGVTCDLVLIIQDISGLYADFKRVVEMTAVMTKLKSVGLNSRYRVDIYNGGRTTRAAKVASYQKKYDKRIFPLYQSYDIEGAKEKTVDNRQNIFSGAKVWVFLIFVLVFVGGGITFLLDFLDAGKSVDPDVRTSDTAKVIDRPARSSQQPKKNSEYSDNWRIAGTADLDGFEMVVLVNSVGRLRYFFSSQFSGRGPFLSGVVDGETVTRFSGGGAGSSE
ncbi:zonular occludens toxin family protein [Alcaligenes nematophilus]|uniref:zonular occludens toxin family protein n=1 Tax=Alcaligenes nematophilus TaxID=2994643 RepID=UPI0034E06767